MKARLLSLSKSPLVAMVLAAAAVSGHAQRVPAPAAGPASSGVFASPAAPAARPAPRVRSGDYIVAVVNNESVTANELAERLQKGRDALGKSGGTLPPEAEMRKQALDSLIEDRVMTTYARDNGVKVDDAEVDRAISNIASSNKMTPTALRERLRQQGLDYATFRNTIRDQITIERLREREVVSHIRVTDTEINDYIAKSRSARNASSQIDLAQILVTIPDKASPEVIAQRQQRADEALARVRNGEPFEQVAREVSEDANKAKGGEMGSRPVDRYPDLFTKAVDGISVGGVSPVVRSGAGFHILKVLSRGADSGLTVTQTRVRHILLRPSAELTPEAAVARLNEFRTQIADGSKRFEDIARQYSEDGSAAQGGDLGWTSPGAFVPEFEQAMDKLPISGLSAPIQSRFGIHLIQVLDRREVTLEPKQVRDQAIAALREQKFEPAYDEWVADLRAKAFIEYREPPQ